MGIPLSGVPPLPHVLHVLPADATLSLAGLEEWIDAGRGFEPLVAMRAPAARFAAYPALAFPEAPERWDRVLRVLLREPGRANGWLPQLEARAVAVVHLHDLEATDELVRAAHLLGVPVVVSWPRGADPAGYAWHRIEQVLVSSPGVGDRLQAAGCPQALIRVAPPPLRPLPARTYKLQRGEPVRWVTAATLADPAGWRLALEAFAVCRAEQPECRLTVVTASALEGFDTAVAARGLSEAVDAILATGEEAARLVMRAAHAGVFPVLPSGAADVGLDAPAWMAAALGLPLVLGREAGVDGFFDHQQALLAEPTAEALGKRMAFLACRPYIWEGLGQAARIEALGRFSHERAAQIPLEVYRALLSREAEAWEANRSHCRP